MKLLISLLLLISPLYALKINIISWTNGVGLEQDIDILYKELTKLGHQVDFIHFYDFDPKPKADINIFVELVEELHFELASKNYLIPNPEWFTKEPLIPKFDLILCKTKEAMRLFQPLNPHVVYLGFTSKDCFYENIQKDYRSPLHLAGHSIQKGTDGLLALWRTNPKLPLLHLLKHREPFYPGIANVEQFTEYLPLSELRYLQNRNALHLCPSETEGFGHYIVEALSTGAVVVTTNAPPMNEFVSDPRCLVNYNTTWQQNLATNYYFDPESLRATLTNLLNLPDEELQKIGRQNRQKYLEIDRSFKQRIAEIFGEAK